MGSAFVGVGCVTGVLPFGPRPHLRGGIVRRYLADRRLSLEPSLAVSQKRTF